MKIRAAQGERAAREGDYVPDDLTGILSFQAGRSVRRSHRKLEYKAKDAAYKALEELQSALHSFVRIWSLPSLQLSGEELADLNHAFHRAERHICPRMTPGNRKRRSPTTVIFVFVMLSMLFGSIFGGGAMVASEVSSEKSSRVMEILITSVKPLVQMFGKIIGVFLVGFLQIAHLCGGGDHKPDSL